MFKVHCRLKKECHFTLSPLGGRGVNFMPSVSIVGGVRLNESESAKFAYANDYLAALASIKVTNYIPKSRNQSERRRLIAKLLLHTFAKCIRRPTINVTEFMKLISKLRTKVGAKMSSIPRPV